MKKFRLNSNGFTLVEILVVVAVSSVIILIIYSAHRGVVTSIHRLTGVAEFLENINLAMNRIDRDIACMHYNKKNKKVHFIGESNYESPHLGKFNFVTVDHNDMSIAGNIKSAYLESDIKEVGYFLEPDAEIPELYFLMRREENHYDGEPEEGGKNNILLENVLDLRFEFMTRYSKTWSNKIDSKSVYKTPKAVKTTLVVRNYNLQEVTFSFITLVDRQK